jgi:GNAT superfamily N-acetyltransferase
LSLYADYIKEREGKESLEVEQGFATYEIVNEFCYIEDIYIKPEARKTNLATRIADEITQIAKGRGCKQLLGSVLVGANGDTTSLKVLLAYGMKLDSVNGKTIYFSKEI